MKIIKTIGFCLLIIAIMLLGSWLQLSIIRDVANDVVDKRTMELCRAYSLRDHRLEIGEERFKWLSQWGDPNDPEFFYQSCIGHVTGKAAEKEYMK